MKPFLTFMIFIVFSTFIYKTISQVSQQWYVTYNGPVNNADIAIASGVDADGNIYITGYGYGSGTGLDYITIKYNSSGVQQWIQRYNSPINGNDQAYAMEVDANGNVYVTGYSTGSGTAYDYLTIKYNTLGVQQWIQRYNDQWNAYDEAHDIAVDKNGNVIVTGFASRSGFGYDYATIKYDSLGNQQWIIFFNGANNGHDVANSIAVDSSGFIYVTGYSTGSAGTDCATLKYSPTGVQQWVSFYNHSYNNNDEASSIVVDNSGNSYICGFSFGLGTDKDFVTIKYNYSGVEQWSQRYNGPGNNYDIPYSMYIDNNGNIYTAGGSMGFSSSNDYAVIKYNNSGIIQWVQRYNGPGNSTDFANSVTVDNSGNVYLTGLSIGNATGGDATTIKYNSVGVEQWVQRYNGISNGDDAGNYIVLGASGNIFVTGTTFSNGTLTDCLTIKYSQTVNVSQISSQIPDSYFLHSNYPNPFNPSTEIKFELPQNSFVTLKVYNAIGEEVASLVNNEWKTTGIYSVKFDGSNLASGIYFYSIQAGNFTDTKKMVLIK